MGKFTTFGARLKEARLAKGFSTQAAFAKALGITTQTVNYYEQDKRKPDYEMFGKIADTLDVSCEFLLGKSDAKQHENTDICALTGLSENAIEFMKSFVYPNANKQNAVLQAIEMLLTCPGCRQFWEAVASYLLPGEYSLLEVSERSIHQMITDNVIIHNSIMGKETAYDYEAFNGLMRAAYLAKVQEELIRIRNTAKED